MNRRALRRIVEQADTRRGQAFDCAILVLILVTLSCLAIETLPGLSDGTLALLRLVERVSLVCFALEYVLRIWVAERPLRYATSFLGIVDFVAILPSLAFAAVDTRALRALRLLRLVRLLKIARYNRAVRRLHMALKLAWEELVLFFSASIVLLFVASVGIYQFERDAQPAAFASVFHAMWWAIATLTTVGYGDVYPVTLGGKAFTFLILLIGLGVVAMPAGLIASALTKAREIEEEEQ